MIVRYDVYVAGRDRMERYTSKDTEEEAIQCAKQYMCFNAGSVNIWKVTEEEIKF